MIARALGIDPLEFRRKNMLREGRPQATGTDHQGRRRSKRCSTASPSGMNWKQPFDRGTGTLRRGRGIAIGHQGRDLADHLGRDRQRLRPTAAPSLYCGTVDMGQGSDTAMAQIAGEVLDIAAESVKVVHSRHRRTPYDMGTLGSRSLFHMGHAVQLAAEEARDKIKALARDVGEPEGSNIPLPELFQKKYGMQAGNIVGTGIYMPDYVPPDPATGLTANVTPFWMVRAPPAPRSRSTPRPATCASRGWSTWSTAAGRSIRRSSRRRSPAPRSCSSASRCSRRCISTPAR